MNIKEFRPISLIRSGYKTLAKVFTNRWKTVLRELSTQHVFIHGRQLHCVLIECLECRLRERNLGVLCKLDLEKTYDLVKLGFSPINTKKIWFWGQWLKWMYSCISNIQFSVLVNGTSIDFFASPRGLRQRSPLLFVFMMEDLV